MIFYPRNQKTSINEMIVIKNKGQLIIKVGKKSIEEKVINKIKEQKALEDIKVKKVNLKLDLVII